VRLSTAQLHRKNLTSQSANPNTGVTRMAETLHQRPGGIDGTRQLVKDAVDAHPLLSM
jgi:hypothetical protein